MIRIMFDVDSAFLDAFAPKDIRDQILAPGEVLFRQDDKPGGLFMITEGRIDLVRHTAAGAMVRIHSARAPATFAEASLFSDKYHCDAVARTHSTVRCFSKRAVFSELERRPELARAFSAYLARALREARRLIELRSVNPLSERLYLRLQEHAGDDGRLPASITIKAIAEEIGATPEASYRALAELERIGRVRRRGRRYVQVR
jgi:CRP/FNR family transcriptional regulator, dissimilatory nitrate respiration regulator